MSRNCLNFDAFYRFVAGRTQAAEASIVRTHLQKCQACRDEERLVRGLYEAMQDKQWRAKGSQEPQEPPQAFYDLLERYFQGTLSSGESRTFYGHLAASDVCFSEFSSVLKKSRLPISEEERRLIDELPEVQTTDRFAQLKAQFMVPAKRSSVDRMQETVADFWRSVLAVPRVAVAALLVLALVSGSFWGYHAYRVSAVTAAAGEEYSDFLGSLRIQSGHVRPADVENLAMVGQVRSESLQDRFDLAKYPYILNAIELDPQDARLNHYIGSIYFFGGEIEKAEHYYRKALALDPDYAKVYNDLALVDVERGQFDKALDHLKKALQIKPGFLEAHYNMAVVLELAGRKREAIAAWVKYHDLDASSDWGKVAESRLHVLRND